MDKVNQGTVVACLSRLIEVTERHNRTLERIESLLVDNTVVMSKNADSTTRLRWAIERYEKNETEREESRIEYDKKVSEERKYELGRWRRQHERWTESERRRTDEQRERYVDLDREKEDNRDSRDSWKHERRDEKENRLVLKSMVTAANRKTGDDVTEGD